MKRFILEQLEHWKNKKDRKPLILKGARQVGKTYILKKFGEARFPNYHIINFENQVTPITDYYLLCLSFNKFEFAIRSNVIPKI